MGRMLLMDNMVNNQNQQVEGFCLIKSAVEKINAKGNPYLDIMLSDAGGEINAKLWDYDKATHSFIKPEVVVKVRATVNVWRDTEQLKVDRIRVVNPDVDDVDMTKIIPDSPYDTHWMFGEIEKCAEGFENSEIKELVLYMLNERKEKLLHWPAALKLHHAHRGGLLFHTFTMLKVAKELCENYAVNRELVFAGIILHDLAKTDELCVGQTGIATGYTVRGQLLGHIAMGMANIEVAAQKLSTSEEIKTIMEHIILAHHSTPEFGSPKPPMFPEAEIVATIDMLDARMYEMYDALEPVEEGGFSERQWSMDNRMLYKHKK